VLLVVAVFAFDLAWRVFAHAHAATLTDTDALSGPPVATQTEIRTALNRFVSYGYPVLCGGGHRPLVALTFDDGPGPYTKHVVRILKRAGAQATFFIVAKEIDDWPGLAGEPRREAAVAAIGDHSYTHMDLVGATQEVLDHEVVDSKNLIQQHAGVPVRLFRPPYGDHDLAVDAEMHAEGMIDVLWNVDSQDGLPGSTARAVLHNVLRGLRPGAIVLMHENRGTTLHDLPRILQAVRARGLHTVTVPALLAADPPSLDQLRPGICH
jgi:peptidoglycan/xylan/chitin deacetylase (PgdA/CDA1 family)